MDKLTCSRRALFSFKLNAQGQVETTEKDTEGSRVLTDEAVNKCRMVYMKTVEAVERSIAIDVFKVKTNPYLSELFKNSFFVQI